MGGGAGKARKRARNPAIPRSTANRAGIAPGSGATPGRPFRLAVSNRQLPSRPAPPLMDLDPLEMVVEPSGFDEAADKPRPPSTAAARA